MQNFTYIITDSLGIHARPAGLLVKEAAKYKSSITILAEGKSADARRLLALMGLGIRQGTEITCRGGRRGRGVSCRQYEKLLYR